MAGSGQLSKVGDKLVRNKENVVGKAYSAASDGEAPTKNINQGKVSEKEEAEVKITNGYSQKPHKWFAQRYFPKEALNIAFESGQLSSSDLPVDLYNSGVNQILSAAAAHGHNIYHFTMDDLVIDNNKAKANMSILKLDQSWDRENPLEAHRYLRVVERKLVPLTDIQLFIVRGDDIRTDETENLEILRWASEHSKMLESVDAALITTDKFKVIERAPQLPHPVTYPASTFEEAKQGIEKLPWNENKFVLKDRFGYGCGNQVHLMHFDDPELDQKIAEYLEEYSYVIVQEYCPEIAKGDIVVTFFDDELIGAMYRQAPDGEWKTNASSGASEVGYNLTAHQEAIAKALKRSFPECRLASVDILDSGKILEINAFPGGRGLLKNYGISIGEIVMDRLERELLGKDADIAAPAALSWLGEKTPPFPTGTQWPEIDELYEAHEGEREVYDVFSGDKYNLDIRNIINFEPKSPEYIVSIPHSGVFVPEKFRDRFKLSEKSLVEIDLYSDLLYETSEGMHVRSELAPFFVDMNREREGSDEDDLQNHLTNPADEYYDINNKLMIKEPYSNEEREEVLAYYDLYHYMISALIERMKRERGYALLFDCHSMTSTGLGRVEDKGDERANFVIGTLEGSSADSAIIKSFSDTLKNEIMPQGLDLSVARDVPYAGGFITRNHHNPKENIHVIQIEVSMDTYMYEAVERADKRYAIKKPRLKLVRNAVREAFRAACVAAEHIHRPVKN